MQTTVITSGWRFHYVLDDWGILVYHRNKDGSGELQCFQKPKKLCATMREYALVEAIKRNLK